MSFKLLNIKPVLLKAVEHAGYTEATDIQVAAIPVMMSKRDLIAIAQTGTGKTAAFTLPALQRLLDKPVVNSRGPRVLILAPTRELALQVKASTEKYAKFLNNIRIVSILGGVSYFTQNKQLSKPIDVLIATPGRLLDHMKRGRIDFSRLEILVLDEADRMLDMGFYQDVKDIVLATPQNRQTLMFSATWDQAVAKLAQQLLNNPERIDIAKGQIKSTQIQQTIYYLHAQKDKFNALIELLAEPSVEQVIVFTATKIAAHELADLLKAEGYSAAALHGDLKQGQRNRMLDMLRKGKMMILVATDVASRGIDISTITHVINFDLPRVPDDYVHRIGRTGRAGRTGVAISLATVKDRGLVKQIERHMGQQITVHPDSVKMSPHKEFTKKAKSKPAPYRFSKKDSHSVTYKETRREGNPPRARKIGSNDEQDMRHSAFSLPKKPYKQANSNKLVRAKPLKYSAYSKKQVTTSTTSKRPLNQQKRSFAKKARD